MAKKTVRLPKPIPVGPSVFMTEAVRDAVERGVIVVVPEPKQPNRYAQARGTAVYTFEIRDDGQWVDVYFRSPQRSIDQVVTVEEARRMWATNAKNGYTPW